MHCFKIIEIETGKVVAWARWGYPFTLSEEEKARRGEEIREEKARDEEEKVTRFPVGANEEACVEYFGSLDVMRDKYMRWDQDYS